MIFHKVFKYLVIVLCLVAAGFFIYTIGIGDEAIQVEAADPTNTGELQNKTLAPMMYVSYIIMALIVGLVFAFVIKGVVSSPASLKSSLMSIGIMLVIWLIAYYGFADGNVTDPITQKPVMLNEGEPLTPGTSKLVGGALWMFYIIALLAIGTTLWSGVSKILKR